MYTFFKDRGTMFRKLAAGILVVVIAIPLMITGSARADEQPITFHVMRKGDDIGTHTITFEKNGDLLNVNIKTRITVKVLFVDAYRFTFDGSETWKDGHLIALNDRTNDNGEKHDVSVTLNENNDRLLLTSDSGTEAIPSDTMPGSWWNFALVGRKELLDVLTGKIQQVTIKKVGIDKIKVAGQDVTADHYQVSGGLERNLWFKSDGSLVKQSVVKKGDLIEYVLK
jgi:hypothetical protein